MIEVTIQLIEFIFAGSVLLAAIVVVLVDVHGLVGAERFLALPSLRLFLLKLWRLVIRRCRLYVFLLRRLVVY